MNTLCIRITGIILLLLPGWLTAQAPCDRPELLQANATTDTSALLTWADVGDAYEIEIREATQSFTGVATHTLNADPPFEVTGLTSGLNYRFQVRTVCGDSLSPWSVPRSFTTELNNARPCPLNFDLRDTSCNNVQAFRLHVDDAPGNALGTDVEVQGVRLMVEHPWRSDLRIWLVAPDSTRVQLIGGLNAGDKNIGNPAGAVCAQFVELSHNAGALPLSAATEIDNFTGYYIPVESLSAFNNGQAPNGVWQVEICDNKLNDRGKLRLFQIVFAQLNCLAVDGLSVQSIDETSVEVQWTADAPGDSLLIEYGPAGFIPGNGPNAGQGGLAVQLAQPAAPPLVLSGLQPLQWYEVYVRRQCGPGFWGPNTFAERFFTDCPYTLRETADTMATCTNGCSDACPMTGVWQNASGDDFEWKIRTGPGLAWPNAGPPSASGGNGNYFYFRNSCSFSGAFGKKAFLRTLCIAVDAPASASCHFSFELYMHTKLGQMGSLALQASTDGGQSWTTVKTWTGNQGKGWRREYLRLDPYHGQIALFQFVATGTVGAYGDIAIDNPTFYGAQIAGTPDYIFYRDADNDSFGNAAQKIIGCTPVPPPGYVVQAGDCNDANPNAWPGAPEIRCNGMDENCNGNTDDGFIAAPQTAGVAVCSGADAVLTAQGTPAGQFYWFDSASGGNLLGTGSTLSLNNLQTSMEVFLLDSISAVNTGCASARTPATVTVHPTPELVAGPAPAVCTGAIFNLNNLDINDIAAANGTLTFHSALPPNAGNWYINPNITPAQNTTVYVLSQTTFGCADTLQTNIGVLPRPGANILQGELLELCRNRSVGLQATDLGTGAAPLSFSWSNGLNFANIPVQSGNIPDAYNTYTVTVTDANGCSSTDAIQIHTLNSITQTAIIDTDDVSACGGSDGKIILDPVDGLGPYKIAWSGPVSGMQTGIGGLATINNLKQGSYRVTVTDANAAGCSMVMPVIVLNAPGLSVTVDTIIHPACPGDHTGSIVLQVNGQNPTFNWSNGQITSTAVNLGEGPNSVTITDGNCVQSISNLDITAPPDIQIILNKIQHTACYGAAGGAIDLAVFNATPPYAYAWSNNAASQDILQLEAGPYTCTITDNNGCTFVSPTYDILQPDTLQVQTATLSDISCFGGADGALSVSVSGGTTPYTYVWSNAAEQPALEQLPAGAYALTLTDANNCTAVFSAILDQPDALDWTAISTENPTCVGAENGKITLVPQGGVAPYTYAWNTGGTADTLPYLDNRASGMYSATLTDANGCSLNTGEIALSAPQLLDIELLQLQNVACFGEPAGLLSVAVTGWQGALFSTWNNQPAGLSLNNIPAGVYVLEVRDDRQCTAADTFELHQPDAPLLIELAGQQAVQCYNESNGSIDLLTSGGTEPYTWQWSNDAGTEDLSDIPAGAYSATVTDAAGCTAQTGPIDVEQPAELVLQASIQPIPCFGANTGNIQLSVEGGVAPYTYFWSHAAHTEDVYDLSAGRYTVTVIDATGCAQVLSELEVLDKETEFGIEVQQVMPVSCPNAADGFVIARVLNGTPPFQFSWSPPVGLHANVPAPVDSITGLSGGSFSLTVTDAAGCQSSTGEILVEEAPATLVYIADILDVACKGDASGSVLANASGGLPPYTFLWNNGDPNALADSLAAGTYRVTVSDLRGCEVLSAPVAVLEPAQALQVQILSVQQDVCGRNEGAIQASASGGRAPYDYLWSNGDSTASISGLPAGTYQLSVTDNGGCLAVSQPQEMVSAVDSLQIQQALIEQVLCYGDSSGAITVVPAGGTPVYNLYWNNGASGSDLSELPAGNYQLTIVDQAGCTAVFSYQIQQPAGPLTALWDVDSTATGWEIHLDISGGAPSYDIQWDAATGNQTGPVASNLSPGLYSVTITDESGCTAFIEDIAAGVSAVHNPENGSWHVQLAPNPAGDQTRLYIRSIKERRFRWILYSPDGRVLQEGGEARFSLEMHENIVLEGLPEAVYWLAIQDSSGEVQILPLIKS